MRKSICKSLYFNNFACIKSPKIHIKMKTIKTLAIPLIVGIIIGFIANRYNPFKPGPVTPVVSKNVIDTSILVPTDKAARWVARYDTIWSQILDTLYKTPGIKYHAPVKYFTIRSQDLLYAMGFDSTWSSMTKYKCIRVNLGYSDGLQAMKAFI